MSVNKVSNTDGSLTPIATNTSNSLSYLSDVDITLPSTGQILQYDGSEWGNGQPAYQINDIAENTLADDDKVPFYDTSASAKRSSTWSNIKAKLKTYFDTLYATIQTVNGKAEKTDLAPIETSNTATAKYEIGQEFYLNDILYTATQTINIGDTITVGTNCALANPVTEQINELYATESDNEAYTLRQSKGTMVDLDLVGATVAWNQLADDNAISSSYENNGVTFTKSGHTISTSGTASATAISQSINVNLISGHKYLKSTFMGDDGNTYMQLYNGTPITAYKGNIITSEITATFAMRIRVDSGVNTDNQKTNFQLFDLTQLFGSTIADAIYAMEQAESGSGVAFFRKYFPNDYYAYDAGSLQSVNVASRKVCGKNLLPMTFDKIKALNSSGWTGLTRTTSGIKYKLNIDNDGNVTSIDVSGTSTGDAFLVLMSTDDFLAGDYKLSFDVSSSSPLYIQLQQSNIYKVNYKYSGESNVTLTSDGIFVRLVIEGSGKTVNATVKPMLRFASVIDNTFEPYKESIYPFDSTKQLYGLFNLVNGKFIANGDEYKANGQIVRKYGIVDLGTLTWGVDSTSLFYTTANVSSALNMKIPSSANEIPNAICAKYQLFSFYDVNTLHKYGISIGTDGRIRIWDDVGTYADASAFKTAMSGVYFVYELATSIIESAQPYQNPQRACADGIEEFIDAGTRDITIPVGNNSKYYLNKTLPFIEDYVDGVSVNKMSYADNGILGAKNIAKYYEKTSTPYISQYETLTLTESTYGVTYIAEIEPNTSYRVRKQAYGNRFRVFLSNDKPNYTTSVNAIIVANNETQTECVVDNTTYKYLTVLTNNEESVDVSAIKCMVTIVSDNDLTYQPYAQTNRQLTVNKAETSVISEYVEDGPTCKNPNGYSIGQHFQRNGKFCTCIANTAQGETWTLNTNYVEGTIADNLTPVKTIGSGITSLNANITILNTNNHTYYVKYGNLVFFKVRFEVTNAISDIDADVIQLPFTNLTDLMRVFITERNSPYPILTTLTGYYDGGNTSKIRFVGSIAVGTYDICGYYVTKY